MPVRYDLMVAPVNRFWGGRGEAERRGRREKRATEAEVKSIVVDCGTVNMGMLERRRGGKTASYMLRKGLPCAKHNHAGHKQPTWRPPDRQASYSTQTVSKVCFEGCTLTCPMGHLEDGDDMPAGSGDAMG